jgi:hypothetical protein
VLYLNSDGKQFHQYQQNKQSPLVFTLNKTSNHLLSSPSTKQAITSCLHPQQNKQSPLVFTLNKTSNHLLPSPSTKQAITSCLHPQQNKQSPLAFTHRKKGTMT